jgi:hypothetical protein
MKVTSFKFSHVNLGTVVVATTPFSNSPVITIIAFAILARSDAFGCGPLFSHGRAAYALMRSIAAPQRASLSSTRSKPRSRW